MNKTETTEEIMTLRKSSYDQLAEFLIDLKQCNNMLSQAIDKSLYQCKKMVHECTEEFQE